MNKTVHFVKSANHQWIQSENILNELNNSIVTLPQNDFFFAVLRLRFHRARRGIVVVDHLGWNIAILLDVPANPEPRAQPTNDTMFQHNVFVSSTRGGVVARQGVEQVHRIVQW